MRGVQAEPLIDLDRRRDLAGNFRATVTLYGRFPLLFLALAFVVVLPVGLLVHGFVLGGFTGDWDPVTDGDVTAGDALRGFAAGIVPLVFTAPLVTAAHARAILAVGAGETPRVWPTIAAVLPRLPVLVVTVLLADVAIALGLVALVVPGVYLWVILQFASQVVAVEGLAVNRALVRSTELAGGQVWRILGYLILVGAVARAASELVAFGLQRLDDSFAIELVADLATETLTLSVTALVMSLLYFDLRLRHADLEAPADDPSDPEASPPSADSAS
jgi:hypothetical protein